MGKVEEYILAEIEKYGAVHMSLLDPEEEDIESSVETVRIAEECGTSAVMVGGSTFAMQPHLDELIKAMKEEISIPIILFPNNVTGISRYADAIWFMSLLNSIDPYFITGAQALGAFLVKAYNLEALPTGYIIVGEGGSAGFVGRAYPVPYNKPKIAASYALAAQLMGMRFVYLEAGSGASRPVPPGMIEVVRKAVEVPLIVGGGIRDGKSAENAARAGANIIVTGTLLERERDRLKGALRGLIAAIRKATSS